MDYYQKNRNLVLRPFGTGTSCVDTIYGECVENVSLENCMTRCEESPYCKYGLYIEPKNSTKKFCLPLIYNRSRNLSDDFISNKNKSKLSDITTFFYDKRYFSFDDVLPQNVLFLGSNCLIKIKYNDGSSFILSYDLRFTKESSSSFGIYSPNDITRQNRIADNEKVSFHLLDNFQNISFDAKTNKAYWDIYSPEINYQAFILENIDSKEKFVNSDLPIWIRTNFTDNKTYYWNVNKNMELILTLEKPKNFIFQIQNKDIFKNDRNFTNKNTEEMEKYLEKNFETNHKIEKKKDFVSYLLLFLFLLCIFFFLLGI